MKYTRKYSLVLSPALLVTKNYEKNISTSQDGKEYLDPESLGGNEATAFWCATQIGASGQHTWNCILVVLKAGVRMVSDMS